MSCHDLSTYMSDLFAAHRDRVSFQIPGLLDPKPSLRRSDLTLMIESRSALSYHVCRIGQVLQIAVHVIEFVGENWES